ncbi:hypothetical protein ACWDG9_13450 [Streptomyces sp. NPDC001073]
MITSPGAFGVRPVNICLPSGTLSRLADLQPYFDTESTRAYTSGMSDTGTLTSLELAARKGRLDSEKEQLRLQGLLIDSKRALVVVGLVQEIASRGWQDRKWDPLPGLSRGRWPGSTAGGCPEKITVDLPADLVNTVKAGCWDISKEAIGHLREWRQRHPTARPNCPTRPGCPPEAVAEYNRYAAQVLTAGAIWRLAVDHGIATALTRRGEAAIMPRRRQRCRNG